MTDQRGLSLVELLIAAGVATVVLGGFLSFYLATARSIGQSTAQAALQQQGTRVLEDIGRQVRGAVGDDAISFPLACNGVANSVLITTTRGGVCYYAGNDGALCEFRGTGCRNLLGSGLTRIVLLTQTAPPHPRCPAGVPAGKPCFIMTPCPDTAPPGDPCLATARDRLHVRFAIRDGDGDPDGTSAVSFATTLTCAGRNC
jgi:hypothetical protein